MYIHTYIYIYIIIYHYLTLYTCRFLVPSICKFHVNFSPRNADLWRSGGRTSDLLVLQEPLRRLRLEVAVAGGSRRDHAEGG